MQVVFVILLLATIGIPNANAQNFMVEPSSFWHLDNFIEDVEENTGFDFGCFCGKPLVQLQAEHAQRQQELIDELDSKRLPIPIDFETRRADKLNKAENTLTGTTGGSINDNQRITLQKVITDLRIIGELNEIRILHSQLNDVKNSDPATKANFNNRVNSLQAWKEHCNGVFFVEHYDNDKESWSEIKERCPKLADWERNYGFDAIRNLVVDKQ